MIPLFPNTSESLAFSCRSTGIGKVGLGWISIDGGWNRAHTDLLENQVVLPERLSSHRVMLDDPHVIKRDESLGSSAKLRVSKSWCSVLSVLRGEKVTSCEPI